MDYAATGPITGYRGVTDNCQDESLELQDIKDSSANTNLHYIAASTSHRSSTSQMERQTAICLRSACKRYSTGSEPAVIVLDRLNMTVPKGVIYGLLGASGCGKTTLLNCIVARNKLDSGEIWVLDREPSSRGGNASGLRIGYMPQETALYGKFTILEHFQFFGWIAGLTTKKIRERSDFLINLLMLPNPRQMVEYLSGGQRRCLSLGIALLHEPELLILDEPTVGLDAVLREAIWNQFLKMTREENVTVVITSHYIEETRRAHIIALMRGGRFLAEESPERLLAQSGLRTLEEVFFNLSYIQNSTVLNQTGNYLENPDNNGVLSQSYKAGVITMSAGSNNKKTSLKKFCTNLGDLISYNRNHMKALLWKNCLWMMRNIYMMMFALALPFLQCVIISTAVGHNPTNLPVAVVNYETNNVMKCAGNLTCNSKEISCHYLKYLEKDGLILIPYGDEDVARESVLKGQTYASIIVRNNYTEALHSRVLDWQYSSPEDIISSEIDVFRDVSSKIVANHLKAILYENFQNFLQDYMSSCNIESRSLTLIKWGNPIYGQIHPSFADFTVPGIMLLIIWLTSSSVMVLTMMIERNEGFVDRIFVVGIKKKELLTSHIICQFVIMSLQSATSLICVFIIFNLTLKGPLYLVIILTLLMGFFGMCYGLCVSCFCETEKMAFFVMAGSGFPAAVISGILWPIEGLPCILKPFASVLPFTYAVESMRSILQRGSGFSTEIVYMAFSCISLWIGICLIITILVLKYK